MATTRQNSHKNLLTNIDMIMYSNPAHRTTHLGILLSCKFSSEDVNFGCRNEL